MSTQQLLVIDTRVNHWQALAADLDGKVAQLVLDPEQDGVAQIDAYVQQLDAPLQSIHLLSHGGPGSLSMGSTVLSSENIDNYSQQLSDIGSHLISTGDILLYGCDVAQGDAGSQFIDRLAQLSGADVTASSDATGSAAKGGDWQLEQQTGAIETAPVLGAAAMRSYEGVLATAPTPALTKDQVKSLLQDYLANGISPLPGNTSVDNLVNQYSITEANKHTEIKFDGNNAGLSLIVDPLSDLSVAGEPGKVKSKLLAIDYVANIPNWDIFDSPLMKDVFPSTGSVEFIVSNTEFTSAKGVKVNQGTSLLTTIDLSKSDVPFYKFQHDVLGINTISVIANTPYLNNYSVKGVIQLDKELFNVGGFSATVEDFTFGVETSVYTGFQPKFVGSETVVYRGYDPLSSNEPDLRFTTGIGLTEKSFSLFGQGDFGGNGWVDPFGLPGATVRHIAVESGMSYQSVVESVGLLLDVDLHGKDITLAVSVSPDGVDDNGFSLTANKEMNLVELWADLNLGLMSNGSKLLNFAKPIFDYIPITIVSTDNNNDGKLDPVFSFSPFGFKVGTFDFAPGLHINSKVKVGPVEGTFKLNAGVELGGASGELKISHLKLGDVLELSGENGSDLQASFSFGTNDNYMKGFAELKLFGMETALVEYKFDSKEVKFNSDLKVGGNDGFVLHGDFDLNIANSTFSANASAKIGRVTIGAADIAFNNGNFTVSISEDLSIPKLSKTGIATKLTAGYIDGKISVEVEADLLGQKIKFGIAVGEADWDFIGHKIESEFTDVFGAIPGYLEDVGGTIADIGSKVVDTVGAGVVGAIDTIEKGFNDVFHIGQTKGDTSQTWIGGSENNIDARHFNVVGGVKLYDADDRFFGNGGDDSADGQGGNDLLDGGAGNDTLWGDWGRDILNGGDGDDHLYGGKHEDLLYGGSGNDTIYGDGVVDTGADGGDEAHGGLGNDLIYGGGGNDKLYGDGGNDTLHGDLGDDTLYGGADNDILDGGDGNDTLDGGAGNDTLDGGAGNDTLYGGAGDDVLDGGAGGDVMRGGEGSDTYYVNFSNSNAADTVIEDQQDHGIDTVIVRALPASITSYTLQENIEILRLEAPGNLDGFGNALDNKIYGNSGNNTLDGKQGNDFLSGGKGDDTYIVDSADDVIDEGFDGGTDRVESSAANYTLGANVENLTLTVFFTNSKGINGTGNGLNNILIGNEKNNTLKGEGGDDYIQGGGGDDTLEGGSGSDTFNFEENVYSGQHVTITDFGVGDSLRLSVRNFDKNSFVSESVWNSLPDKKDKIYISTVNGVTSLLIGGEYDTTFTIQLNGTYVASDFITSNHGAYIDAMGMLVYPGAQITLKPGVSNDAPAGTDKTLTLAEDGSYALKAADFGFSDSADATPNAFKAIVLSSLPAAGQLTLAGAALALGQTISVADINAGKLVFTPAANASGQIYASLNFQVQDDGGTTAGGVDTDPTPNKLTFNVTAVNDAPTISGLPSSAHTVTAGTASALNDFRVADADGDNLTVTLTATNGTLGNLVDTDPNSPGITLTGTVAGINAAIAGATFKASGAGAASVAISVSDGVSASPTLGTYNLMATAAANTAPGFGSTLGGTVAYTEGANAVALDNAVQIADTQLTALNGGRGDYTGASLTITRQGGANGDDLLGISSGASFTVNGGDLKAGGLNFATVGHSDGSLSISFTGTGTVPTQALVNEVLSHITYANGSSTPPASVTLAWSFSDGNSGSQGTGGALIGTGTSTVSITAVDAVPDTHLPTAETENSAPSLAIPGTLAVAGDGNGDGIKDATQDAVASLQFGVKAPEGTSLEMGSAVFVTLVSGSNGGKANLSDSKLIDIRQVDAPADMPSQIKTPVGMISFSAAIAHAGHSESFGLYVDPNLGVNGYWKQDASGTWANLASEVYGGKTVLEGGKLRLDFSILDGGEFDADHLANGIIKDLGAIASMPLSITEHHPITTHDTFWF